MGGEDAVLEKTLKSFEKGEYRWVTEICKHLVFANPDNMDARYLEADALEQMAYQTENATWRNAFLSGAHELRNGTVPIILDSSDALFGMPNEALMEYLGLLLDCSKADGKDLSFNVNLTDRNVKYNLEISNAVLIYKEGTDSNSNFDLNMDLKTFLGTIFGKIDVEKIAANNAFFKGDKIKLKETLELFSPFPPSFNLVLP